MIKKLKLKQSSVFFSSLIGVVRALKGNAQGSVIFEQLVLFLLCGFLCNFMPWVESLQIFTSNLEHSQE